MGLLPFRANGARGETRTLDLRLSRKLLYPAELPEHIKNNPKKIGVVSSGRYYITIHDYLRFTVYTIDYEV